MDRGPFRAQQPSDSRSAARPQEPAPRQVARPTRETQPQSQLTNEPLATAETPRVSKRSSKATNGSGKKRFVLPAAIVAVLLALASGWFAWSNMNGIGSAIDKSRYQAVFFTNGQVYFGKLEPLGADSMKLTDVYYLQAQNAEGGESDNPQETSSNQNDVQLIKLGDEVHGPEDEMILSRDQMLFFENLKTDGKVAQTIDQYKSRQ